METVSRNRAAVRMPLHTNRVGHRFEKDGDLCKAGELGLSDPLSLNQTNRFLKDENDAPFVTLGRNQT
ncbi:hypothetical protein PO124_09840 [Bacillus licheniformis]|nr:hypothetical protein [Bacillus licheniformis]